ncbi:MAG: aminoacyl-tRNA hydrolase [Acholeplasmataceae bacterium]
MKVVVGLGNPGAAYRKTRHNIGFIVVDEWLKRTRQKAKFQGKFNAEINVSIFQQEKIVFMKPSTYMNRSGGSIASFLSYYQGDIEDLLVIVDDVNLPTGRIRLRESGGHGGHNGLRNIIDRLGSESFKRIRIGVGNDTDMPLDKYVLGKISAEQKIALIPAIESVIRAIDLFVSGTPFNDIMTRYNTRT